jgi:hypothetical protein
MKLKELAAESGLQSYGAVAMAIKRYETKLACDASEAGRMNSIIHKVRTLAMTVAACDSHIGELETMNRNEGAKQVCKEL